MKDKEQMESKTFLGIAEKETCLHCSEYNDAKKVFLVLSNIKKVDKFG
jgi:hypothetical protein